MAGIGDLEAVCNGVLGSDDPPSIVSSCSPGRVITYRPFRYRSQVRLHF